MDWLGTWEQQEAPGRHSRMEPAYDAVGYQYHGQVLRAIPVDGRITETPPTWSRSPQVRFWLDAPKKPLGLRIREWLTK